MACQSKRNAVTVRVDRKPDEQLHHRSYVRPRSASPTTPHLDKQLRTILGIDEVDCAVDAVGFEASAHGGGEAPATVLNSELDIPGYFVTGAADEDAQHRELRRQPNGLAEL